MRQPMIDDVVRLTRDVPELHLARGSVGVVRGAWSSPMMAYEVEFPGPSKTRPSRALLMDDQLNVEDLQQLSPEEALALSFRNKAAN